MEARRDSSRRDRTATTSDCFDSLKARASQLGGATGMRFLRSIGKPAFVTTGDVVVALCEQVIAKNPNNRKQEKFLGYPRGV